MQQYSLKAAKFTKRNAMCCEFNLLTLNASLVSKVNTISFHTCARCFINTIMSYYSDANNVSPGRVEGNPAAGLRHRVAVAVERILDSALKQEQFDNITIKLSGVRNSGNEDGKKNYKKFKFISANSSAAMGVVENLSISRLEERPSFARIKCTVAVPLLVKYNNSTGEELSAQSEIKVDEDVIMYVPQASVFPFEVKAMISCNCPSGRANSEHEFTVTALITIVIKIIANTDLLLPTYGYCPSPRAVDYDKSESRDFFDLPLYPSGKQKE